ncbi:MAG: zinc ribbon domain-containing protein [Chloroflexi bacterium]|nr:zinc ribbon domain-containing protein [Chloroflexota bacterium]
MPTYDYRCEKNGHEFEVVQGFNDAPGAACPACGSASQRKISAAALHFKGSGWYRKDNSSSSHASANGSKSESDGGSKSGKKESSDKSSSSSGSDSKSDSKSSSGSGSSGSKTQSNGGSTNSH